MTCVIWIDILRSALTSFTQERSTKLEIWKPHKKYTNYSMSTEGRIKNSKTGKILKPTTTQFGYSQVTLRDGDKYRHEKVHRLIADTFIEGDNSHLDIRHKNEIRTDNSLHNLEYCTRSQTIQRAFDRGTKIAPHQTKVRVVETGQIFSSVAECSKVLGLSRCTISKCINGAVYTCGGLHFEKVKE